MDPATAAITATNQSGKCTLLKEQSTPENTTYYSTVMHPEHGIVEFGFPYTFRDYSQQAIATGFTIFSFDVWNHLM